MELWALNFVSDSAGHEPPPSPVGWLPWIIGDLAGSHSATHLLNPPFDLRTYPTFVHTTVCP